MVPALFDPWSALVDGLLDISEEDRILDIACGTGAVARRLARRVGSGEQVFGLDFDPGKLGVAARENPDFQWLQGDAEALPFDDACFNIITCQFGMMYFEDSAKALREMHRVLAPGGTCVILVWDSREKNEVFSALDDIYARMIGGDIASILACQYRHACPERLSSLLHASGIENSKVETRMVNARFQGVEQMILADARGWLLNAGFELPDSQIQALIQIARKELACHVEKEGRLVFPTSAHVVRIWKPILPIVVLPHEA